MIANITLVLNIYFHRNIKHQLSRRNYDYHLIFELTFYFLLSECITFLLHYFESIDSMTYIMLKLPPFIYEIIIFCSLFQIVGFVLPKMLLVLNLAAFVASVSAQSFSFGTSIGSGTHDAIIPPFDSQRASPSAPSSRRGSSSPSQTFSEAFSRPQGFPNFSFDEFSSSKFVESSPRRSQPTVSSRAPSRTEDTSRNLPAPSRSASRAPVTSTRARDSPVTQTTRGNPLAAEQDLSRVRSSPRSRTRASSSDAAKSSRGRAQLKPVAPSVTRPISTTTPAPNVVRYQSNVFIQHKS